MTKRLSTVLLLALALAIPAHAEDAADAPDDWSDPGARFATFMMQKLEALTVPCPLDLTDTVPADRDVVCGKLRQDEGKFRDDWKAAVRQFGKRPWKAEPASIWQEDPGLITRYYDLNYVQAVAIFDTETKALMIVHEKLGPCEDSVPAPHEVSFQGCIYPEGTDAEAELACPEPTEKVNPQIPESLRVEAQRYSRGEVKATLSIDETGAIDRICIVSAYPDRLEWIREVVNAFRGWKVPPGTVGGKPVPVRRTFMMTYSIR